MQLPGTPLRERKGGGCLRLPLEHEDGAFAVFMPPGGSKAEVFGPSDPDEGPSAVPRSRAPHVQQPCSNPSRTEPNTAGMRKPSIDRNRRI